MEVPQISFSLGKMKSLKIEDSEYSSAHDFFLTEEEKEKARTELHETDEKKIIKLQELRDKLARDNDVNYRTDTPYLLSFLRVRKYDVSKAYQNIRGRYTFRKKHPYLKDIPENFEKLLNLDIFRYLPYMNKNGNVLFFFDIERWKLEDTSVQELAQLTTAICNIINMNPRVQVNGAVAIWNMKGSTPQKLASILTTYSAWDISFYIQNMHPWRLKFILVLNTGRLFQLFYRIIRPFLSKKISERIILLGSDIKELHQYVDPALLPKSLGGILDESRCSVTQNILDNISYLKYDVSFS